MGGADFCKFSHAFRHGLLLSERILQISPGKNDNLPLMATTSTVWGSGSIGLSLVAQSRPPQISLLCGFCPLAREFALRRTFQPPQSDFLQIPPRDGHPCLWLTVPATESVVDFHHQVVDHAGRTQISSHPLVGWLLVLFVRHVRTPGTKRGADKERTRRCAPCSGLLRVVQFFAVGNRRRALYGKTQLFL